MPESRKAVSTSAVAALAFVCAVASSPKPAAGQSSTQIAPPLQVAKLRSRCVALVGSLREVETQGVAEARGQESPVQQVHS